MRIDLNAKVRTRDGADVGHIEQVIFEPQRDEVTGVVVNTGAFLADDDVVVPRADIDRATADGGVIVLQLTREQFDQLERFVPEDYDLAPVGWMPPPGGIAWGFPTEAYLWAVPTAQPAEPPHLDRGAAVVDRDGDSVGTVEDVEFAPDSGRIERFTVKIGGTLAQLFGTAKEVELLPSDVASVEAGEVRLSRDKDEILP